MLAFFVASIQADQPKNVVDLPKGGKRDGPERAKVGKTKFYLWQKNF
jgi:hypothetical protein